MNRIYLYSTAFCLTLAIFIFFGINQSLDGLIFLAFVTSSILFVFAREELPKAKHIKILEVRQYHEKRVNIYGYTMSSILIAASLIFTFLTYVLKLNLAVTTLLVWFLVIISFTIGTKIIGDRVYINNLVSYLKSQSNLSEKTLREIVVFLEDKQGETSTANDIESLLIKKFSSSISIPFLHETHSNYLDYKLAEANAVSPDEISEINKN